MRVWIVVGCAVLIVGAALWPFGRKTEQLGTVPVPPDVAAKRRDVSKPEPARIVEVIDLARAYDPVREPEEPAGTVNPASFIQVPDGPRQIPPALEWDAMPERIDVMPREVATIHSGLLNVVPNPACSTDSGFTFIPMSVPYATGITQPIPPNAAIIPVEKVKSMPREVPAVKVKQEEQERRTSVRDDEFTFPIDRK